MTISKKSDIHTQNVVDFKTRSRKTRCKNGPGHGYL